MIYFSDCSGGIKYNAVHFKFSSWFAVYIICFAAAMVTFLGEKSLAMGFQDVVIYYRKAPLCVSTFLCPAVFIFPHIFACNLYIRKIVSTRRLQMFIIFIILTTLKLKYCNCIW